MGREKRPKKKGNRYRMIERKTRAKLSRLCLTNEEHATPIIQIASKTDVKSPGGRGGVHHSL